MRKIERRNSLGAALVILGLMMLAGGNVPAQDKPKRETFQATAMGQAQELGKSFNVNINIEEYSTPEDQQALLQAFNTDGMEGLSKALGNMKSKGRLSINGMLGYEVTYIRSFQTKTGRRIRIVTNRPITFGEARTDSRSSDYNLSAVELEISNEKGKSTGILLPVCQFKIGKDKHLAIKVYRNAWKLTNIMDR
jgi:hypothetical protein